MELHHVQLAIPPDSEDLCREFYCVILGWTELEKPYALANRGGLWMDAGSAEIHLGVEKGFRPAKKAHPAFLVDDLEGLASKLDAAGFAPSWDTSLPDLKRFFVFDCVGNRLEFMQR